MDAAFAAWLAARNATRPWPVNRIEWTTHLEASFEIVRAAHADSRKGDGAFADVLDIMACQWLNTLGVLHHYRRLSAALAPDERAAMPSTIYRFLDGLESTQGPADEHYVRWLRRGPSAAGRWCFLIMVAAARSHCYYLAVLGYTNFRGIDIGGDFGNRNAIAAAKLGGSEDALSVYGGKSVPLPGMPSHLECGSVSRS